LKKEIPESSKAKESTNSGGWAMEIFKGDVIGEEELEKEDGMLELDLEEEETAATSVSNRTPTLIEREDDTRS
jgi:hypothetical protein